MSNLKRPLESLPTQISAQIMTHIREEGLVEGAHMSAQSLADRFGVSRSPVQKALAQLVADKVVRHEPKRGFFVTGEGLTIASRSDSNDPLAETYLQIADDRLRGELPDVVSEAALRERYDLTQADLRSLLLRMQMEGWLHKRRGYGWMFHEMLTTPDGLEQTYRLRAALEPAILLEPGFRLDPKVLNQLIEVEKRMLDGEIDTASIESLYARGVNFHEALAEASGNPFMLDSLRRVNQVRRLLAYRSMVDRSRYYGQAREHLEILDLISRGSMVEASVAMRHHLGSVMVSLQRIEPLLR
ncbi:transcriptional regulator, GntR family [Loktanella atrilutea]|uniref:Transcriptional regulator, GntR family n=1 Tax=Loktanella atrilutea TaxID=366533 RepID=A0A1M5FIQ2_LOKAT|nr:GntR family transcriptional regulator [Loktanella atrilutea]SHF91393.1 transcriptional regulator, GntR family [Loktanella atrilutea]